MHSDDTVLQLSQFAYATTTSHSSSRTPDPGQSRSAGLITKDFPDHWPNSQFAKLSKCVACGLEWTSRKTTKQKRTHVLQCAKKHALTKDTIKILVEKEIAISSPTQNTVPPSGALNESTLLDSVVPGPVKNLKRQQVLATVKSLPETRDSILNRAREVLGPTDTNDQEEPQPTQQFGQSTLDRRSTQHSRRPALLDTNEPVEKLPSTQPFGASALRARAISTEQPVDGREESTSVCFGASLFAQDSVSSSICHKRPPSSPPANDDSRTVRRRLL